MVGCDFHETYRIGCGRCQDAQYNSPVAVLSRDNAALRARVAELEENVKKAWEECHATSSALSKATQDRDRWRACAVYLDYRGADYCVAIHRELDGLQTDNAEHREQMSKLLTEWRNRATRAEAERDEARARCERLEKVRGAAAKIRHWHDHEMPGGDGMVVSADAVRELWSALAECREVKP